MSDTAVFYDIENLMGLFTAKSGKTIHLDEIYRRIRAVDGVNGISVQKAYADWLLPSSRLLRNNILQLGIEAVQVFNTNQNDRVKNASDVNLIIDAVDLMLKRPDIKNYVIVSGDGIFAFLAKKLHEYGKLVIGCGFSSNANVIFLNACDHYIYLEKTDKSIAYKKSVSKHAEETPANSEAAEEIQTETPQPKPIEKPQQEKQENKNPQPKAADKLPKNKFTEALQATNTRVFKNTGDPSQTLLAVRDIVNALFTVKNSEASEMEVSMLKTYIDHYVPGLKLSMFKQKRFGEFARFILSGSPYCIYVAEGTTHRIGRRGATDIKGEVMSDLSGLIFEMDNGTQAGSLFDIPSGTAFTYSVSETQTPPVPEGQFETDDSLQSIRKHVKTVLFELSESNGISVEDATKLTTVDFCRTRFGIKTPVLKEIPPNASVNDYRRINGKIKYWKEIFTYNGKSYLVFKEWNSSQHRMKFEKWLESVSGP